MLEAVGGIISTTYSKQVQSIVAFSFCKWIMEFWIRVYLARSVHRHYVHLFLNRVHSFNTLFCAVLKFDPLIPVFALWSLPESISKLREPFFRLVPVCRFGCCFHPFVKSPLGRFLSARQKLHYFIILSVMNKLPGQATAWHMDGLSHLHADFPGSSVDAALQSLALTDHLSRTQLLDMCSMDCILRPDPKPAQPNFANDFYNNNISIILSEDCSNHTR